MTEPVRLSSLRDPAYEGRLPFLERLRMRIKWVKLSFAGTKLADVLGVPKAVQNAVKAAKSIGGRDYDPDSIVDSFKQPVMNPMIAFHEALAANGDSSKCSKGNPFAGQKVEVKEAWVMEGQVDEYGTLLIDEKIREAIRSPWPQPLRMRHVRSNEAYVQLYEKAKAVHKKQPERAAHVRESIAKRWQALQKLKEDGFVGDSFLDASTNSSFDPNQYSEYAPLVGGPYFRQLYIYDFLKQVAYAFEAQNHNPLAKAIIRILVQYALGRRFEIRIDDEQKEAVWNEYEERVQYTRNVCEFWGKEAEIYGDFIYDWQGGFSVDPSTIWDIITDPERINQEYYYYQSYPTAYQMFTGYSVPGEPGSADQAAAEYIIRQIPAFKLQHMKLNCVSNEKRGRSTLFPILGWLKRIKDLYNAQVIREWLYSCFMWDVTIDGNQADVSNYVQNNAAVPLPGSRHVHNKTIEMKPLPAIETGSGKGGSGVGEELMCFIAVACGIPKEFLNITSTGGGGSRAQALTSAEPFTKMIEDIQSRWEWFTTQIFKNVIEAAGLKYAEGDVEITFPSVTKDTTSETLKNLTICEEMKWFDHKTCAEMAAKEMNITNFDWDKVMAEIKKQERAGFGTPAMPTAGTRFGDPTPLDDGEGKDASGDDGKSDIHGDGKRQLSGDLKTL